MKRCTWPTGEHLFTNSDQSCVRCGMQPAPAQASIYIHHTPYLTITWTVYEDVPSEINFGDSAVTGLDGKVYSIFPDVYLTAQRALDGVAETLSLLIDVGETVTVYEWQGTNLCRSAIHEPKKDAVFRR